MKNKIKRGLLSLFVSNIVVAILCVLMGQKLDFRFMVGYTLSYTVCFIVDNRKVILKKEE